MVQCKQALSFLIEDTRNKNGLYKKGAVQRSKEETSSNVLWDSSLASGRRGDPQKEIERLGVFDTFLREDDDCDVRFCRGCRARHKDTKAHGAKSCSLTARSQQGYAGR